MPKNNPATKNKMVAPKVKGSWWNRDMSMLTTLVPLKYLPVDWIDVPGRTQVDVSPKIDIESLPAVSPLYDGWTLETYYYFVPYRLYMPTLRINNIEDVGDIDSQIFPTISYHTAPFAPLSLDDTAGWTGACISPGSLLHRLGFLPSEMLSFSTYNSRSYLAYNGSNDYVVTLNAIPLLAYLDTWLYSQFNKQDHLIPVESSFFGMKVLGVGTGLEKSVAHYSYILNYELLKQVIPAVAYGKTMSFPGAEINELPKTQDFNPISASFNFHNDESGIDVNLVPNYPIFDVFSIAVESAGVYYNTAIRMAKDNYLVNNMSNTGLLPVTYFGDRFTSWFNADSVNRLSQYSVSSGDSYLSMRRDNSNMFLDMISMVSGNDYRSYLKFVYGTELDLCDHPILVGKDSLSFGFMDVLNQSANISTDAEVSTNQISQSLAYTAGKARSKNNNVRDINFKTREPGLFMVLCSLRPTIRYFQGVDAFLNKREYSELWHPQYSSLGFQQIRRNELYAQMVGIQTAGPDVNYSDEVCRDVDALDVYVPIGWEYQTGMRKLNGAMVLPRFRTWSLARDFEAYDNYTYMYDSQDVYLKSTYGNRSNFDFNFVDTSDEAQNFIMNFSAKVRCFQPMSKVLVKPTI